MSVTYNFFSVCTTSMNSRYLHYEITVHCSLIGYVVLLMYGGGSGLSSHLCMVSSGKQRAHISIQRELSAVRRLRLPAHIRSTSVTNVFPLLRPESIETKCLQGMERTPPFGLLGSLHNPLKTSILQVTTEGIP